MGVSKCAEHFVEGVKGMSEPIMILILAWSLGFAMNDIHTSEYIAGGWFFIRYHTFYIQHNNPIHL